MSIHSFDDRGRPSSEREVLERRCAELEAENEKLRRTVEALRRRDALERARGTPLARPVQH
ncbi:hypothetical protein [Azospirillum argentinense]|uniref:hypothetical protein n=1 Tax=Azospirillum argentinense TaxID=2970906 RepID=UPI0032DF4111